MKIRSILLVTMSAAAVAAGMSPAAATQTAVQFNLIDDGGVSAGGLAYQGFSAAANYWSSILTTSQPVTVNLKVGYQSLGQSILGQTGSSYDERFAFFVENRIKDRQFGSFDAQAAANLPTLGTGLFGDGTALKMYTPGYTGYDSQGKPFGIDNSTRVFDTDGGYNNSVLGLTTANGKALGYDYGSNIDGQIIFSSDFNFDFNPGDGISAGSYDFIGVAIHEIGHALGFVSGVDDYDVLGTGGFFADKACLPDGTLCKNFPANDGWFGNPLDLFRYSAAGTLDWTTSSASYFSIDQGATAYNNAYFSTGEYNGDGWQASHWKSPVTPPLCSGLLGVMNPYLCNGQNAIITGRDLAALDAIGWNINQNVGSYADYRLSTRLVSVPEPSTWAMLLLGLGGLGAALRRRRLLATEVP